MKIVDNKDCCLGGLELFEDFSTSDLEKIGEFAAQRTWPKGKILFFPEELGKQVFIVKEGKVRISEVSSEGEKLTLAVLGNGSIFGELALMGKGTYELMAEALEDSVFCILYRKDLERLIEYYPKLALKIIEVVGKRLRLAHKRLQDLAFKNVSGRVASLLLELSKRLSKDPKEKVQTSLAFSQEEWAEMVGSSREALSRALAKLKAKNLIHVGRRQVEVIDRAGLEEISNLPRYSKTR